MARSGALGLGGDIVAYAKSEGAFIGVALEGAVIRQRADFNREYYGDDTATARAIVLEGGHANPQANELRETLAGY